MTLYAVKSTGRHPHNLIEVVGWTPGRICAVVRNKDGVTWWEHYRDLARVHVERVC